MPHHTVFVLSGPPASGKTTTAALLQRRLSERGEPTLHLELDAFIDALPDTAGFDPDEFERMERAYHRSVAESARELPVVADHLRPDLDADLLADHEVWLVGLRCALSELERREAERPPERRGFASEQFEGYHRGRTYDVELDTAEHPPAACVDRILARYDRGSPEGFAATIADAD
ncbi:phosphotransferase-like protein [Halobacterium zhouii]|uniref:phosphotransferase-like protein n=1 Tax=Halobacterium zhouii TaxID=2902624 RepID=UPI001E64FE71|nr:AAA family ATPase [Halobacterium zhouii]